MNASINLPYQKLCRLIVKKQAALKKCRNPFLLDKLAKELFELVEKSEFAAAQKRNAPVAKKLYIFFGQQIIKAQTSYTYHRLRPGNRASKALYLKQLSLITDTIGQELCAMGAKGLDTQLLY
ncbi:MAG: hypothetical protein ACXVPN_15375 [Bacteroidia bacterium]